MSKRAKNILILAAVIGAPVLWGCTGDTVTSSHEPAADSLNDRQVQRIIIYWLDCDDCTDREFESVIALGNRAVDFLGQVYHSDPEDGVVVPGLHEQVISGLRATYRRLSMAQERNPDYAGARVSEQEYIDRNLERLNARYQSRAESALRAIGTPDAEAVLNGH